MLLNGLDRNRKWKMNTQKELSPEKGTWPLTSGPSGGRHGGRGVGQEGIPVCDVSEFYKQRMK